MYEEEVCLADMLACRERRSQIQNQLLRKYHCPVISFCMNIPGPVKTNEKIRYAFDSGKESLLCALQNTKATASGLTEFHEKTGDELLMAIALPAGQLKELTTGIEENHPFGRLFDMDVIDTDGQKLSRPSFRKCIICGKQAQECARMRRHTIKEMQDKIQEMLGD